MNVVEFSKKGNLGVNKILVIIIAFTFVALLLLFIFKADILSYLRNLPGFDSPDEDRDLGGERDKLLINQIGSITYYNEGLVGVHVRNDFCRVVEYVDEKRELHPIKSINRKDLYGLKKIEGSNYRLMHNSGGGWVDVESKVATDEMITERGIYEVLKDTRFSFKYNEKTYYFRAALGGKKGFIQLNPISSEGEWRIFFNSDSTLTVKFCEWKEVYRFLRGTRREFYSSVQLIT